MCLRGDKERIARVELPGAVRRAAGDAVAIDMVDTVVPHHVSLATEDREIDRLLERFAGARLVVTDRLHGMIFAAICGTPVVAVDNLSGKVRAVYEAWLADLPYVRFAESEEEVAQAVAGFMASNDSYTWDSSRYCRYFAELKRIIEGRQDPDSCDESNESFVR